jgi:hypothetical protein
MPGLTGDMISVAGADRLFIILQFGSRSPEPLRPWSGGRAGARLRKGRKNESAARITRWLTREWPISSPFLSNARSRRYISASWLRSSMRSGLCHDDQGHGLSSYRGTALRGGGRRLHRARLICRASCRTGKRQKRPWSTPATPSSLGSKPRRTSATRFRRRRVISR